MLARALAAPSNLLVLDEPTNDLDLETLDLLQEAVADYPGTVILVSHDRDFLDRTVTSVLAAEGGGRWVEYAGGYSDMLAQRRSAHARTPTRPEPSVAAKPGTPPRLPGAAPKRKLSFKEKHALDTLPARIAELQRNVETLRTTLADPALFARDASAFGAAAEELSAAELELSRAEADWLELEILREAIEG
jgi:ATP-binding cassette subfamily F protein uup